MCVMFYFGFFAVSGTVVKLVRGCLAEVSVLAPAFMQGAFDDVWLYAPRQVMDEKCGTCLDESSSCNKVTLTGSLIGDPDIDYTDLPW